MKNRCSVLLLAVLLLTLLSWVPASAEFTFGSPDKSVYEYYKLMLKNVHAGSMSINITEKAGKVEYNHKIDLGLFSETVKVTTRKGKHQSTVIAGAFDKEKYKFTAVYEDAEKEYSGTMGKDKRSYKLKKNNNLPLRADRILAVKGTAWEDADEIFVIDLNNENLNALTPEKRVLDEEDAETKVKETIKFTGYLELDKDGNVLSYVFDTPHGEVKAIPCDSKDMKPKMTKELKEMFEPADFFKGNNGVFQIPGYGDIEFSFLPDLAPKHCDRIKHLIEIGYYDGKIFHRFAALMGGGKGRIIQGGSLRGQGVAGCEDGVTIPLEPNGKHDKGTIGMARTQVRDSANSQFYFNLDDVHALDGNYTIWGKVEKGMDILEKMWADYTKDNSKEFKIGKALFKRK